MSLWVQSQQTAACFDSPSTLMIDLICSHCGCLHRACSSKNKTSADSFHIQQEEANFRYLIEKLSSSLIIIIIISLTAADDLLLSSPLSLYYTQFTFHIQVFVVLCSSSGQLKHLRAIQSQAKNPLLFFEQISARNLVVKSYSTQALILFFFYVAVEKIIFSSIIHLMSDREREKERKKRWFELRRKN